MDAPNKLDEVNRNYFVILFTFVALTLASWPILFSFDLWVLKDRSSFLNLDYLIAQHLRLGVDTYYSYGLLPVALQHILFVLFGRGYWPLIGCTCVTLCAMVAFWGRFLQHLPERKIWLLVVVAISPILLWINPNLPYSIVQVSLLFSLLCVLEDRLDIALALAVVGWFSVPSLPLVLTVLLVFAIAIRNRAIPGLLRQLTPAVLTFIVLAVVLAALFSFKSLAVTLTPVSGIKFYKAVHFNALTTAREFFHPDGHSSIYYVGYYLGTPVTWWFASTVALFLFGARAAMNIWRERVLGPRNLFMLLAAVLQGVFAFVARGSVEQHIIYDSLLAAGVLIGISGVRKPKIQHYLLIGFAVLAILSEAAQARSTIMAWKNSRYASTHNLYATPEMAADWSQILEISRRYNVLMLSYGTGAHNYFPTIHTADTWMMRRGQLLPADRERVLVQLRNSDVVVEDLTSLTSAIDSDADIQRELKGMCLTGATTKFLIWYRPRLVPANIPCLEDARGKHLNL